MVLSHIPVVYLLLYIVFFCCFRLIFEFASVSMYQEKRLRVNMSLRKLHEKVKKQQEKVEEKVCSLVSLIVFRVIGFAIITEGLNNALNDKILE